jgi:hypothetical protein
MMKGKICQFEVGVDKDGQYVRRRILGPIKISRGKEIKLEGGDEKVRLTRKLDNLILELNLSFGRRLKFERGERVR